MNCFIVLQFLIMPPTELPVNPVLRLLFGGMPLVPEEAFRTGIEDLAFLLNNLEHGVVHGLAADVARDLHPCLNSTNSITASGEPGPPTGPW